jgi:hypothetical protein
MTMKKIDRRRFIIQSSKVLAFIPFANIVGCNSDFDPKLDPEESLKNLISILGPWTLEDDKIAYEFAKRFIKTEFAKPYLKNSNLVLKGILKQIPDDHTRDHEINLTQLTDEESIMLMDLTQQLYSFVEVRFYASNEPGWGICQGDSKWHTRIPEKS